MAFTKHVLSCVIQGIFETIPCTEINTPAVQRRYLLWVSKLCTPERSLEGGDGFFSLMFAYNVRMASGCVHTFPPDYMVHYYSRCLVLVFSNEHFLMSIHLKKENHSACIPDPLIVKLPSLVFELSNDIAGAQTVSQVVAQTDLFAILAFMRDWIKWQNYYEECFPYLKRPTPIVKV